VTSNDTLNVDHLIHLEGFFLVSVVIEDFNLFVSHHDHLYIFYFIAHGEFKELSLGQTSALTKVFTFLLYD
jgi:hypothetical protein